MRLVQVFGVIVPQRLRADWRQEWEAELQYREQLLAEWARLDWRNRLDLLRRSLGAFWDALLLQPQRLEDEMFQDLRYGLRMLLKHKGFTLVAVLSLALGIGANTALFSLVDAVLLKTLPVGEPERLVLFEWLAGKPFRTNGMRGTFDGNQLPGMRDASVFRFDTFEKLRQAQAAGNSPLESLFAFAPIYELTAVVDNQAEVVFGQAVTGGYYAGLKVPALYGRTLVESDDKVAAAPVVVLSHQYWQERFTANPAVIGQQLKLNNHSFTIIGVTPPGFTGSGQVNQRPAVTVPLAFEPTLLGDRSAQPKTGKPGSWWLLVMGRLKPGATLTQARDSLNGAFQAHALEIMPPPRKDTESAKIEAKDYPRLLAFTGSRGAQETRRSYSATIYGLFAVVAAVLLIACANVANLLLARAALRGPEITVRLAVGAGRGRLIRQLLTESVLLSLLGGAVGVLFAFWGKRALAALADRETRFLPEGVEPSMSWRVLLFTVAVSLLTGVLFGLAPAWRGTRADLAAGLKQARRTTGAVSRLSKGLVVAQVALSLLLLIGAGLFIRTLRNLQHVDVGFNQDNLLLFAVQPRQGGYKGERLVQFYQQLFAKLEALPGVRAATFGAVPLISHFTWNDGFLLPGETVKGAGEHIANRQFMRENYFSTLEIPLLRGRAFTAQDVASAPQVAIVNQTLAKKFFPGLAEGGALGKHVRDDDGKRDLEIVGIVADTKYNSQRDDIEPLLFTSWQQELDNIGEMYFTLRTSGEPTALTSAVHQAVRELDATLPVTEFVSQRARAEKSLAQERLYARLLSFFGGLALLLAAIGLSGVLAYSVAQRTNEIGVRMALGAQTTDVLRLIIWQGMKLVLLGLVCGTLTAYIVKRLVASQYFAERSWQRQMADQLYGVSGTDPVTIGVIALLLASVALLACWWPARRAAQVDPLDALRHE
ncbi:MAG: ABC transporter permease [Acidobacteria bacterium]|nr:ABC transporter permease [Acidobacteriota bacterium]